MNRLWRRVLKRESFISPPLTRASSSSSSSATPWGRTARQIKDSAILNSSPALPAERTNGGSHSDPYLQRVQSTLVTDPVLHPVRSIEQEIQEIIGQALGKQGQKVTFALSRLQNCFQQYESCLMRYNKEKELRSPGDTARSELKQAIQTYNAQRQKAIQVRWELLVHRQAAGFIVKNHEYVTKFYPIPPALPSIDNHQ
jgi:hypothetical protein